jgi:hypothetical protein
LAYNDSEGNAMTAPSTLVRPSPLTGTTTAIFAVLGLIDVALVGAIGTSDPPPLAVSLGVAALGLITLGSLVPANRGSRGALGAIVLVRVISALLAVPAFFLDAPAWVRVVEGFVILATICALILLRRSAVNTSVEGGRGAVSVSP